MVHLDGARLLRVVDHELLVLVAPLQVGFGRPPQLSEGLELVVHVHLVVRHFPVQVLHPPGPHVFVPKQDHLGGARVVEEGVVRVHVVPQRLVVARDGVGHQRHQQGHGAVGCRG